MTNTCQEKLLGPISRSFIAHVTVLLLVCCVPPVFAQDSGARSCDTEASDPDGDGFGWEWNRDIGALATCTITENTLTAPVAVNPQTGEEVQLIRAYWNANRDIAGRNIECKAYRWDDNDGTFINLPAYNSTLNHHELPYEYPFVAFADYDQIPFSRFPDIPLYKIWTVIDGRYIGPMSDQVFGNAGDFDYIELIGATESTSAGIRIWGSGMRECFDASGAALVPTGFIGEDFPVVQPAEERSLIVVGAPAPEYAEPLTNLVTGEEVGLAIAHWDFYRNFWQRSITCLPFSWNGSSYSPQVHGMVINRFYAAEKGPQSGFVGTRFGTFGGDGGTNETWTVVDGRLEVTGSWLLNIYDQVEIIPATDTHAGVVRSWVSSEAYTECWDSAELIGIYENELNKQDFIPLDPEAVALTEDMVLSETDTDATTENTADENDGPSNVDDTSSVSGDNNSSATSSGGGTLSHWLLVLLLLKFGNQQASRFGNIACKECTRAPGKAGVRSEVKVLHAQRVNHPVRHRDMGLADSVMVERCWKGMQVQF